MACQQQKQKYRGQENVRMWENYELRKNKFQSNCGVFKFVTRISDLWVTIDAKFTK